MKTPNTLRLLSDYLKQNAANHPDKTAFVFKDQRISYSEFNAKTETLAKYLLKSGIKKQDRIAYLFDIQPEFFYLLMAASRIGAILAGLGNKQMPSELESIINCSKAQCVFVSGGSRPYVSRLAQILPNCPTVNQVVIVDRMEKLPNTSSFEAILRENYNEFEQALIEREAQVDTDDNLLMLYTSGTSGHPKGALLTQRNIIHSGLIEAEVFASTPNDIWLDPMPVNHVGGAVVQGVTPLLSGSTVVLLTCFSPTKVLQLIETEKVSVLGQVPTMYAMELNLVNYDEYDKSSLRVVHFGASLAPKNILEKVAATMTTNLFNSLGMTEASGIVASTPRGSSIDVLSKTVGKVIPGVEWKLVDKDRKIVQRGQVGEIAYRGQTIIKEYYNQPEATAKSIDAEGWLYTGDLFREDENGLLELMGRKGDMFITGGENVYPCEVEQVICCHTKVAAAAVLPAPDPIYGEVGYAFIIPKPDTVIEESDLRLFLGERLAKYKVPAKYIFRSELPLNPTGKIAKKVLKQELQQKCKN